MNDASIQLADVDFVALAELCERANFTSEGFNERLGADSLSSLKAMHAPVWLDRTSAGDLLDVVIRTFSMGARIPPEQLQQAIAPIDLQTWIEARLLRVEGDKVVANVKLTPHRQLICASDFAAVASPPADFVMGIGSSTISLANLAMFSPHKMVLDMGCGSGLLSLLAARAGAQVVGIDCNPRAVEMSRFNARLNACPQAEFVEGNLFDPVAGRKFDLVVSNPPFVISPESQYTYRDADVRGDQFCRRLLREAPSVMAPDGYCQIVCNWPHIAGRNWEQDLASWFDGLDCDAWVLRSHTYDPYDYAAMWVGSTESHDPAHYAATYRDWSAFYKRESITAISMGQVAMRYRPGADCWFRVSEAPQRMLGNCGPYVLRAMAAQDFLANCQDDDKVLESCLELAPEVRLEHQCAPNDGRWGIESSRLHLTAGFAYDADIDPYVTQLVIRCDGRTPLRALVGELAAQLGHEPDAVAGPVLQVVRTMVENGFLLPEG